MDICFVSVMKDNGEKDLLAYGTQTNNNIYIHLNKSDRNDVQALNGKITICLLPR